MWHYSMCRHYPMCCPIFLSWYYLHYTLWSLDTHISLIWSPILEIFSAMNMALHFLHIYSLNFHLKKKFLPSNFEKILWGNKFLELPHCRNDFLWKSRWHCFLWELGLWILTIQPFHSYTLAYCRPFRIISIEFQNIDNDRGNLPKKLFLLLELL
jgi:hypothetical protein